ncbi:hypothetical protein N9Y48_00395 [Zobellia sp.]|nr:hypothetical protein [Zobellia sp.]
MIPKCPPFSLVQEAISMQTFVFKEGSVLLGSVVFMSILFSSWYFGVELSEQRNKARLWLVENIVLLQRNRVLKAHLEGLGKKTSICKNCNSDRMQLWNYQQRGLLVVRCRSCKRNYTLTKEHNEYIQLILSEMDGNVKLVNTLIRYRYQELGKLLGNKLAIDVSEMNAELNPLEVFHFTAKISQGTENKSSENVFELHRSGLYTRNRNIEFG